MNEFYTYGDSIKVPEKAMKSIASSFPTIEQIENMVSLAYRHGFYDGQRELIEKAKTIANLGENNV